MSKKNIECEYCHTLISEDDVKCPHCGANCSNVIKKYREEHQKEEEEKEKEAKETREKVFDSFNRTKKVTEIIITAISIIMFIVIGFFIVKNIINFNKDPFNDNFFDNDDEIEEEINEKITVAYNEEATTSNMKVILDSYELYERSSKNFESYNTPKGYQKIAFHFTIENLGSGDLSTYSLIELTADDSKVEKSDLKLHPGFEKVVTGKENYEEVINSYIGSGKVLKGYVGYLVPKDKKVLKFYIGDDITIEMENPSYNK